MRITRQALGLVVLGSLAAVGAAKAESGGPKPAVVKTVTRTITEIAYPRAGTSLTVLGTDGIVYQYGVEEGEIAGATRDTLRIGDKVRIDFVRLSENYPPTYGTPQRTTLVARGGASSTSGLRAGPVLNRRKPGRPDGEQK